MLGLIVLIITVVALGVLFFIKKWDKGFFSKIKKKSYFTHLWFSLTARKNKDPQLLHHASAWSYLTQKQWNIYIDALLAPLKIPEKNPTKIFEIGMGAGAVLKRVHEKHPNAHLAGVDPVASALKIAEENLPGGDYSKGNGLHLKKQKDNTYDIVIAHCVVIYLNNLAEVKKFTQEMVRIAKPGSLLMITSMIEEGGKKKGSANIKINHSWWQQNISGATIFKTQVIGKLPGCEHQGDRYAIYLKKG